jgi:hypothetical protein
MNMIRLLPLWYIVASLAGCAENHVQNEAPNSGKPQYHIVHDRFVLNDEEKAWRFPSELTGTWTGDKAIGARKIARVLPTWAYVENVPPGTPSLEPRHQKLFEAFLERNRKPCDFFFEPPSSLGEGKLYHFVIKTAPTSTDDAWSDQAVKDWLCTPPPGAEWVSAGDQANSVPFFSPWSWSPKHAEQEVITPKRNPPSGADIKIGWAPWSAERLKNPDWLVPLWPGRDIFPKIEARAFRGHSILWVREKEGKPAYVAWFSGDKVITINSSNRIAEEVVSVYLEKYPSDLPKGYEFDPERWLINVFAGWRARMEAALDEPAWGMRDQFAWWVWDDALIDQWSFFVPKFPSGKPDGSLDESEICQLTDWRSYQRMMQQNFDEFIWGPDLANPRLDIPGYQAAVVAWRRNYLDVKIPAVIERVRKHGLQFDQESKRWKFGDQK